MRACRVSFARDCSISNCSSSNSSSSSSSSSSNSSSNSTISSIGSNSNKLNRGERLQDAARALVVSDAWWVGDACARRLRIL